MKNIVAMPIRISVGGDETYEVGTIEGSDATEIVQALAALLDAVAGELRATGKLPGQRSACLGSGRKRGSK